MIDGLAQLPGKLLAGKPNACIQVGSGIGMGDEWPLAEHSAGRACGRLNRGLENLFTRQQVVWFKVECAVSCL